MSLFVALTLLAMQQVPILDRAAEHPVALTVTNDSGSAIPNVQVMLVQGKPKGHAAKGSRRLTSARTDQAGKVQIAKTIGWVPDPVSLGEAEFLELKLYWVLDTVGSEPVFAPVDRQEWQAGQLKFQTPPIGFVEVQSDGPSGWSGQRILVQPGRKTRPQAGGSVSSLQVVDGLARTACRLGEELELTILGGRCLTSIVKAFEGPIEMGETVRIGPLEPDNHSLLTVATGIRPAELVNPKSYFYVTLQGYSFDGWPGRVMLNRDDLQPDGSVELLIPNAAADGQTLSVSVAFKQGGQDVAKGQVAGPFSPGQRVVVPLFEVGSFVATTKRIPFKLDKKRPLILRGVVMDVDGQPIVGAKVIIHEDAAFSSHERWRRPPGAKSEGIQSDSKGRFAFYSDTDSTRFRLMGSADPLGMSEPMEVARGNQSVKLTLLAPPSGGAFPFIGSTTFQPPQVAPGVLTFIAQNPDRSPVVRRAIETRWVVSQRGNFSSASRNNFAVRSYGRHTDLLGRFLVDASDPESAGHFMEVFTVDGVEPVLHKVFPVEAHTEPKGIVLDVLQPSVGGVLVDESGKPIAGIELVLEAFDTEGERSGRSAGPTPVVITNSDGRFELYGLPQESLLAVTLLRSDSLRLLDPKPLTSGSADVTLVGRRLGGLQLECVLPPLVELGFVDLELFFRGKRINDYRRKRNRQGRSVLFRLDPGEYVIRVSLNKQSMNQHGSLPDDRRVLFSSGPIDVQASLETDYTVAPAIDLTGKIHAVRVTGELLGQRIQLVESALGLRSGSEEEIPFWSFARDRQTRDLILIVDPQHPCEIEMRGTMHMKVDRGESSPLALMSEVHSLPVNADELVLDLKPTPVRTAILPHEIVAAVAPFELWAVIHSNVEGSPSNWHPLGSRRNNPRPEVIQVGSTGTIELPAIPLFSGDSQSSKLRLAVVYRPEGDSDTMEHKLRGGRSSTRGWATPGSYESVPLDRVAEIARYPWIEFLPDPEEPNPETGQVNGNARSHREGPHWELTFAWGTGESLVISPAALSAAMQRMQAHLHPK